jgi:peptidoglycan/LPS O-acetylase OafA/YrhL
VPERSPSPAHATANRGETAHVAALDGWRGIAILLLLIGHFLPVPGIKLGTLGVNLFFVLSGLLMTQLLFVRRTGLARFYWRRLSRIVPAHLTFIVVLLMAWLASGRSVSISETLAALFFVNNYISPPPGQAMMPFGHVWSLSVEEHSYVVLSLLALAARRRWIAPALGLATLALASAACGVFINITRAGDPTLPFTSWLHTEVAAFGIVASGCMCMLLRRPGRWRCTPSLVPLLLLAGFAAHWWSVPLAVQTVVGTGLLALAVNLLPCAPAWLQAMLSWSPLRWLGTCSFSLYLWQQPFYLWTRNEGGSVGLALIGAIAAGLASYYLIERPARRYLNARAPD